MVEMAKPLLAAVFDDPTRDQQDLTVSPVPDPS
jgi:hypothetical protein